MNLGVAYGKRICGERAKNLEQAIACYRQALEVRTREALPREWAQTQMNLGNAYFGRIRGERAENLEQAIACYRQALEVRTREALPLDWARTQMNLGNAYGGRIRGERAENLEQAIACYRQALEVLTREALPLEWARTQMNLGLAYGDRLRGERVENLEQAVTCYRQALAVFDGDRFPFDHLRVQRNLARLYFREHTWKAAHDAYSAAIQASALLFREAHTEVGRRSEVGETAGLFANDAYCLLQLGQPREALLRLEQGKTRLLNESLALHDLDLSGLPAAQCRTLETLRASVQALEAEMRLPPNAPGRRDDRDLSEALRNERAQLNQSIDALRKQRPDFMPSGLDLPGLLALIPPDGALVAPLLTDQGSAVFVLPHGTVDVDESLVIGGLNGFTHTDFIALLRGPADAPQLGGWLGAYFHSRDNPRGWFSAIETTTRRLWDTLIEPIHRRLTELGLAEGAPVLLMPQAGLGLLPLHAAWREVNGRRRYWLEDFTFHYAPSGYALDFARRRLAEPQRQDHSLLAVINPTRDLPFTPVEGEAVLDLFPAAQRQALEETSATLNAVRSAVSGRSYLHFSCHGYYHWQDPMQSGLVLSEWPENPLTLARLITDLDLSATRLVILSACETGLTDIGQSPDEYLGLPAGFMQAGAPSVVSTLWTVNDLSTMLLMERFYRYHLQDDLHPASALRQTQRWLPTLTADELRRRFAEQNEALLAAATRMPADVVGDQFQRFAAMDPDERPFAHPFYWAAFTFSGP